MKITLFLRMGIVAFLSYNFYFKYYDANLLFFLLLLYAGVELNWNTINKMKKPK